MNPFGCAGYRYLVIFFILIHGHLDNTGQRDDPNVVYSRLLGLDTRVEWINRWMDELAADSIILDGFEFSFQLRKSSYYGL